MGLYKSAVLDWLSLPRAFSATLSCSGVVINNEMGVYAARLQLHAPLILVLQSAQAGMTHPASLTLTRRSQESGSATDVHNAWLTKDNLQYK